MAAEGGLTSSVYSLVVLSYATLAFVKFGDDSLQKRIRSIVPKVETLWSSNECKDMCRSVDQSTLQELTISYETIKNHPFENHKRSAFDIVTLHLVLLTSAFLLALEVVRENNLFGQWSWLLDTFKAAPYITLGAYLAFMVAFVRIAQGSVKFSKNVATTCGKADKFIERVSLAVRVQPTALPVGQVLNEGRNHNAPP